MFRCELDALPIQENNLRLSICIFRKSPFMRTRWSYGNGSWIGFSSEEKPPLKGRVLLLFQPSEEDGQGAQRILKDPKFKDFIPDYIFAIHNLPGYPLHRVILSKQNFAAASRGLAITLLANHHMRPSRKWESIPAIGMSKMLLNLMN